MYKRIHATIILENNRLIGVALKIVNNSINTDIRLIINSKINGT